MAELLNRDKLEARFANKLAKVFARHKRELREFLGDPPDISRIPPDFWQRAAKETEEEAFVMLMLIFAQSAYQHGFAGAEVETVSAGWASQRAPQLAGELTTTSQTRLGDAFARWREAERETSEPVKPGVIRDDLSDIFGPKRVAGIAENETTTARHQGSEAAVEATVGLSDDDIWHTAEDRAVCPTCEPLDGTPRSYWSRFFPNGPPDPHSRCRCYVEYVGHEAITESDE